MPYENKTNYTRRQLQNAMIELLEEKPFEKITINDIASHVHVNRSTVYRYYDDKYDLLETIEDQLLAEMNDLRDSFNPLADRLSLADGLEILKVHFKAFHALLGPNGDRNFEAKMLEGFSKRFDALIPNDLPENELAKSVIGAAGFASLKYWLFNSDKIDGNQTIEVAEKILTKGALTYIRRLAQHNQQF